MNLPPLPLLELRGAAGPVGEGSVRAATLQVWPRRFHVLRGAPGCGKEALLRLLGLLDAPQSGEVFVQGQATQELAEPARAELRTHRFGYVFTAPFLLASFTVIENVAMPLFKISNVETAEARQRSEALLELVGLGASSQSPVDELSQLAQHELSIARALVHEPALLLVEALDERLPGEDARAFIDTLHRVVERCGTTVIATASSAFVALRGERVIDLEDGAVVADSQLSAESEA